MAAMKVKHVNLTMVTPEREDGVQAKIPLTIFDREAPDLHVSVLLVYNAQTDSNTKMKLGLAKALGYYPILAGKLISDDFINEPPFVILNHESCVPVIEASVDKKIDEFLPLRPSPELTLLHGYTTRTNPLLMVQLTRFASGGLIIGVCWNHLVADGQYMSNFLISWSQLVCGREVWPLPIHDRSVLRPRDPPLSEFPHESLEFSSVMPPDDDDDESQCSVGGDLVENLLLHYTYDFICKLKERAGWRQSTFECLVSHLWKKITVAQGLEPEQATQVKVAVNGRPRIGIQPEYFGNLVLTAFAQTKAKDLLQEDERHGATLIHLAVHDHVGARYFQSFIDFGEIHKHNTLLYPSWNYGGREPNVACCADLEVDSWLGFQFHQVDMGGGRPSSVMPSWIPEEGIVILIGGAAGHDSKRHMNDRDGRHYQWSSGIDVIVTLLRQHADAFKKMAYHID